MVNIRAGSHSSWQMSRIEKFLADEQFGDAGFFDERHGLTPYEGIHRFQGRSFGIVVWARNPSEAREHCVMFGMLFSGEIEDQV